MSDTNKNTVGDTHQGKDMPMAGEYTGFFNGLMEIVEKGGVLSEQTGTAIGRYVMEWLGGHPLDGFDDYSDTSYLRTCIGRCPRTHWEALVMTWKKGNTTTIHGHPRFAGYHFADGTFQVELFEKVAEGKVRRVNTFIIDRPKSLFAIGEEDRFDNHIHRITCLSEKGHTLHVYSDDARRGEVFTEE